MYTIYRLMDKTNSMTNKTNVRLNNQDYQNGQTEDLKIYFSMFIFAEDIIYYFWTSMFWCKQDEDKKT